jgi:hypothetical protein
MGSDRGIIRELIATDIAAQDQSRSVAVGEGDRDPMHCQRRTTWHSFHDINRSRSGNLGDPLQRLERWGCELQDSRCFAVIAAGRT